LGRRPMLVQIGSTIMFAALPASLALNASAWLLPLPGWLVFGTMILIVGGMFAQYFHGTLHRDDNPAIVRWMRATGLLMTPQAHQLHHDTLTRDFATNNGWSNPVINRLFNLAIRRRWLTEAGLTPQ
jgi:sterol desaturase/sphingolipid hydroxylase (fatty acid hydroxylase superfamily)